MRKDYWIDIHELRYWQSGDRTFIDFHLILPYYFTIEQSHTEEKYIDEEIEKQFPNSQLKIHFDFCVPELCKFCGYRNVKYALRIRKLILNGMWKSLPGKRFIKF